MPEPDLPPTEFDSQPARPLPQELILALLLVGEFVVFSCIGTNFLSRANGFEIVRLSAEIGLLALALTPVIVTGGIDLSVGSLMGLSAVLFGITWRDAGLPVWSAAAATLGVGLAAGGLNAFLITRLRLPPLIVTLGTFSLFRGVAEGLTSGADNFTGFPEGFLFLGQGYLLGGVPAQLPIIVAAAAGYWALLHRTTIGRSLYAIGLSQDGARYAGIPVERRLGLVYLLAGVTSSLAAIIYVAHLGQAKSDAGSGYELTAITAVVLGGTSIFGGRGTIHGTVLGLFAIAVLQNGLRLAALPTELAGILSGALLLVTISMQRLLALQAPPATPRGPSAINLQSKEFSVKNSQLAVLCGVILLGALIVAAGNGLAVRGPRQESVNAARVTVVMMPKSKGNAYFIACRKGAEEAAKELDIDMIWDGPTDPDPAKQNEIVETWITRGVDVIAVSVENRDAISTALRKARQRGIKVVTWDADAEQDARDFFVNQATPEGIGQTLMDQGARVLGGKGKFAIIFSSLTAANMIAWRKHIKARLAEKYPEIELVAERPCDDKQKEAFAEANTILNKYPDVKLIMAICSPAVPAAAEAVVQSQNKEVKVIGLGLPNDNKPYVHRGTTDCIILWNTMDLGYLTVQASYALKKGMLRVGDRSMQAGRIRNIEIQGDNILLGTPFIFDKKNIDRFDF
jgi:ribose/xylose/arabinose/galactoside ABC-type transport system permease subunit/ABC-type sugar transport system substrate-binding protein